MDKETFAKLQPGDIVRSSSSHLGYIVTGNYGDYVVAVRQVHLTNPPEWELIGKADHLGGERVAEK